MQAYAWEHLPTRRFRIQMEKEEWEAERAYWAEIRQQIKQRNGLMGKPLMADQAAWNVLSEREKDEQMALAILHLPYHDLAVWINSNQATFRERWNQISTLKLSDNELQQEIGHITFRLELYSQIIGHNEANGFGSSEEVAQQRRSEHMLKARVLQLQAEQTRRGLSAEVQEFSLAQ